MAEIVIKRKSKKVSVWIQKKTYFRCRRRCAKEYFNKYKATSRCSDRKVSDESTCGMEIGNNDGITNIPIRDNRKVTFSTLAQWWPVIESETSQMATTWNPVRTDLITSKIFVLLHQNVMEIKLKLCIEIVCVHNPNCNQPYRSRILTHKPQANHLPRCNRNCTIG